MNLRNVLRTYGLLRQLTDDETALLTTLRGMSETERDLLVQSLQPEKVVKKQIDDRKCRHELPDGSRCDKLQKHLIHSEGSDHALAHKFVLRGKSARASNMAQTLNRNLAQQRKPMCVACGNEPDHPDHGTGEGQHEFSTDLTRRVLSQLGHDEVRCAYSTNGKTCNGAEGDAIHDATMGYSGYHEFVGAESQEGKPVTA